MYREMVSHVFTSPYPRRFAVPSRNPSSSLAVVTMEDVQEFQESTTIRFEWTLRGLKQLFESRCGHAIRALCFPFRFDGD